MSTHAPKPVTRRRPANFYRPDRYDSDQSLGYLLRRIIQEISQDIERQLEPHGLTNAQWVPLFKLSRGEATTVAELARICQLDAGAMTRLLDRLEGKGLLRRVRSEEDRRVVRLEITPEGREAAAVIAPVLCQVQNQCLAGFNRDEWQVLNGLLRRVLDNAEMLGATEGVFHD